MGFDGKEWFRKKTEPFSDVEKAYEEADPTTFTPVPLKGPLSKSTEGGITTWADGSDSYIEISADPERQQVAARLLKGVVNVSDVVTYEEDGRKMYLSKIMPHDNIQDQMTSAEIVADHHLIGMVFGDYDHMYYPPDSFGAISGEHHNMSVVGGKAVYFDFELADLRGGHRDLGHYLPTINYLEQKLHNLQAHYAGEEGRRLFTSIIKSSKVPIGVLYPDYPTESPDTLYKVFLSRIAAALESVWRAKERLKAA